MFTLKFDTKNAAFSDDPSYEIERILNTIATDVHHTNHGPIIDHNGNHIGQWAYNEEEEN